MLDEDLHGYISRTPYNNWIWHMKVKTVFTIILLLIVFFIDLIKIRIWYHFFSSQLHSQRWICFDKISYSLQHSGVAEFFYFFTQANPNWSRQNETKRKKERTPFAFSFLFFFFFFLLILIKSDWNHCCLTPFDNKKHNVIDTWLIKEGHITTYFSKRAYSHGERAISYSFQRNTYA